VRPWRMFGLSERQGNHGEDVDAVATYFSA
jgi:hypothetical protein